MKALRKQRLCSFLWGWGKWENRPCSIQKRPGISLSDRFLFYEGGTHAALLSIPGRFILARAVQHIPVTRRNSLRRPSRQSTAFTRPRQQSGKKTKGTACAVPPVNLRLSSDRASGLGKKTKGTACTVPPVNLRFSPDRASGLRKRQKGQLASSPCQSMAFTRPRQRSEKKTKGTACAVPPVYGVIIKFR